MPRLPNPDKRAQLLADVVAYLQKHGIAELSLAPLAAEIGTSKRMLIYYFGDRGTLIAEVLAATRPDVRRLFAEVNDSAAMHAAAWSLWCAITRGEQRRSIPILFQALSLTPAQPETYGTFAADAIQVMLGAVAEAFGRCGIGDDEAAARSTIIVSGLRGLCQDLLVTGETARIDDAARLVIEAAVRTGSGLPPTA